MKVNMIVVCLIVVLAGGVAQARTTDAQAVLAELRKAIERIDKEWEGAGQEMKGGVWEENHGAARRAIKGIIYNVNMYLLSAESVVRTYYAHCCLRNEAEEQNYYDVGDGFSRWAGGVKMSLDEAKQFLSAMDQQELAKRMTKVDEEIEKISESVFELFLEVNVVRCEGFDKK